MDETSRRLKLIGIEVDSVVSCLGGNEQVYLSICRKFLKDTNYQLFCSAIDANDLKSAEIFIHTLRGVAANLGFLHMELICRYILENLRNNDVLFLPQYRDDLAKEYEKIVAVLNED